MKYFYHLPTEVRLLFLLLLVHCCQITVPFTPGSLLSCHILEQPPPALRNFRFKANVNVKFHQNLFHHNIIWVIKCDTSQPPRYHHSLHSCYNLHVHRLHIVGECICAQTSLNDLSNCNISEKYFTNCWPMHSFHLLQKIRTANLRKWLVSCLMAGSSNNSLPCCLKI